MFVAVRHTGQPALDQLQVLVQAQRALHRVVQSAHRAERAKARPVSTTAATSCRRATAATMRH